MIAWVELGRARVPGEGAELRLLQRGGEFAILAGATALMNSRMSGSEIALAELACARLGGRKNCRVLIGGYGMGFTLRAAQAGLGGDGEIVVAEIVPEILAWARGPMAALTGESLNDPRVNLYDGDVGACIRAAPGRFDAILLDVDNGPDGLSRAGNEKLYNRGGLEAARKALKPKGMLLVWSAAPDRAFTARLGYAGFQVEEVTARAHKGRGGRYIVWVATK
jgi:spermidine synthase